MDETDGSLFDHIDSLIDFPTEDIDSMFPATGKSESVLPSIWSAQAESLPVSDSVFSGARSCDLSAVLSIPYEDIVQLEWLSTFVEDSFSGGSLDMTAATEPKNDWTFQTLSPVSVLESSSSSCSGEKTAVVPGKCGRARSKRLHPASFSPRPAAIQLVSSLLQCSVHENDYQGLVPVKIPCESSESFAESYNPVIENRKEAVAVEPKKKKIDLTLPQKATTAEVKDEDQGTTQAPIRKCLHCHITKTPQWRAGPLGPKTLCNACGVRYKSGRLFPEYRPAASPTFVPSLHSNSHKKVLDMRSKTGEKSTLGKPRGGIGEPIMKDTPELIPNTGVVQMDYM